MLNLVCGAISGMMATVPMSAVIAAGCATGWVRVIPPEEITANVAEEVGADPEEDSPQFEAAWMAAHLGYGAACGALYALMRPLFPRSELAAGLLFGGAVWGVSYIGVMPALELYPPVGEDSPRRTAVMIAAHAVYGTSLAASERLLSSYTAETS